MLTRRLTETLEACHNLTFVDFEIMVSDNGDDRVRYINLNAKLAP